MKKHLFRKLSVFMSAAILMVACNDSDGDGDGGNPTPYAPPTQQQQSQAAFADNDNTGDGFTFSANTSWAASVNEVASPGRAAIINPGPVAPGSNNQVAWLKLYNGSQETYSGGSGEFSLKIVLEQNYTGEDRSATISIKVGSNGFTVTVIQEGIKEDGEANEPQVQVTSVIVNKGEVTLEQGETTTLAASVLPSDATQKTVEWASSNPRVATVDARTGRVTAVDKGICTISVRSTSNLQAKDVCIVEVTEKDPNPPVEQKRLKKVTITTTDPDADSPVVTQTITYGALGRIASVTNLNYDGPGTTYTTTYTYENDKITANEVYTSSDGGGKSIREYKMAQNGTALSAYMEYKSNNNTEKQIYNAEYKYDSYGQLVMVTEEGGYTGENSRSAAYLSWNYGNIVNVHVDEYGHYADPNEVEHEKYVVEYGQDQVKTSIDLATALSSVYVPGAYEDILPIFGNMGKYLPIKSTYYDWDESDDKEEAEKVREFATYSYQITNGNLMKAVVTITNVADEEGEKDEVYTDTYIFDYE